MQSCKGRISRIRQERGLNCPARAGRFIGNCWYKIRICRENQFWRSNSPFCALNFDESTLVSKVYCLKILEVKRGSLGLEGSGGSSDCFRILREETALKKSSIHSLLFFLNRSCIFKMSISVTILISNQLRDWQRSSIPFV